MRKRFGFYKNNRRTQNTSGEKRAFYEIDQKIKKNAAKVKTNKMIVDFCVEEAVSTKSFAVKEKQEVQVTTRFLSEKKC